MVYAPKHLAKRLTSSRISVNIYNDAIKLHQVFNRYLLHLLLNYWHIIFLLTISAIPPTLYLTE
uniref:Putative ovule protein n=1 Tax=Solanum chacoense TaxID=4108 RepID=A0A0V0GRZ4_SOLCH